MEKNDYRIETLSRTFLNHAEKAERKHEESVMNHRDAFPDSEIPEWMDDPFNLSRALSVMAAEIARLKMICN